MTKLRNFNWNVLMTSLSTFQLYANLEPPGVGFARILYSAMNFVFSSFLFR